MRDFIWQVAINKLKDTACFAIRKEEASLAGKRFLKMAAAVLLSLAVVFSASAGAIPAKADTLSSLQQKQASLQQQQKQYDAQLAQLKNALLPSLRPPIWMRFMIRCTKCAKMKHVTARASKLCSTDTSRTNLLHQAPDLPESFSFHS